MRMWSFLKLLTRSVLPLTAILLALLSFNFPLGIFAQEAPPDYRLTIELGDYQIHENDQYLQVTLESNESSLILAGFDLKIWFRADLISFRQAAPSLCFGESPWEYFIYHWGPSGDCHGECPSGVVRFVGLKELSESTKPSSSTSHELFEMQFYPTGIPRRLECMFLPVRWYWMDCEDNVLTTDMEGEMLVSRMVCAAGYDPLPCYDVTDANEGYPTLRGIQEECLDPKCTLQRRVVDFHHGGFNVLCNWPVIAPGDINLNGVLFEFADYRMYEQYFLVGLSAFGSHVEGSVFESDVNEDGITLHVSDLVILGSLVHGSFVPGSRSTTFPDDVILRHSICSGSNCLELVSTDTLGAMALNITGNVLPTLTQSGAALEYNFDGEITRVLILDEEELVPATLIQGQLVRWENVSTTRGTGTIEQVQVSSYGGTARTVFLDATTATVEIVNSSLPNEFHLAQNYPNPFNPRTSIEFSLPKSTKVELIVYNVSGQRIVTLVDQFLPAGEHRVSWKGTDGEGQQVASGIYLYRISTDEVTAAKKMLLLK